MDQEQHQQSILLHELEGMIMGARNYTLKELKVMRQKIEQAESEHIAAAKAAAADAAASLATAEAAAVAGLQNKALACQLHEIVMGLMMAASVSYCQQHDMARHQLQQAAAIGNCQIRLMVLDRRASALETSASTLLQKYPVLAQAHHTLETSSTTSLTMAKTQEPSKDDVPNENLRNNVFEAWVGAIVWPLR